MFERADQLCDLSADIIRAAAIANPIAGTTIEVICEDDADTNTSELPVGQMKVYVSWERYEDGGPASRGEDLTDYLLSFIVVEVCETAGKVPLAWRRSRSLWVKQCIVDALGNPRNQIDGVYALRLDNIAFDLEELTSRKAFWCGVAITFRDCQEK